MTWFDWLLTAITALSAIIGLFRGFVKEVISVVVWVGGILLALHFSVKVENFLSQWFSSVAVQYALLIVATIIAVLAVSWILSMIFGGLIRVSGMGFINRALGLIFGLGRGVLLASFLAIFVTMTGVGKSVAVTQSKWVPYIAPLEKWMQSYIPVTWQSELSSTLEKGKKELKEAI